MTQPTIIVTLDENRTTMRVSIHNPRLGSEVLGLATLHRKGFARELPGWPRTHCWRWGDGEYHAQCRMDSPASFWADAEQAARLAVPGPSIRWEAPVTFRLDRSAH
jgi:hypothetical protein